MGLRKKWISLLACGILSVAAAGCADASGAEDVSGAAAGELRAEIAVEEKRDSYSYPVMFEGSGMAILRSAADADGYARQEWTENFPELRAALLGHGRAFFADKMLIAVHYTSPSASYEVSVLSAGVRDGRVNVKLKEGFPGVEDGENYDGVCAVAFWCFLIEADRADALPGEIAVSR